MEVLNALQASVAAVVALVIFILTFEVGELDVWQVVVNRRYSRYNGTIAVGRQNLSPFLNSVIEDFRSHSADHALRSPCPAYCTREGTHTGKKAGEWNKEEVKRIELVVRKDRISCRIGQYLMDVFETISSVCSKRGLVMVIRATPSDRNLLATSYFLGRIHGEGHKMSFHSSVTERFIYTFESIKNQFDKMSYYESWNLCSSLGG